MLVNSDNSADEKVHVGVNSRSLNPQLTNTLSLGADTNLGQACC